MKCVLWSLAMVSCCVISLSARQSAPEDYDSGLEKRMLAFTQQVRCLVCQNETLADSRAELAVDLRQQIREQMKAGRSDDEITAFLTDRYGDFVLYRPSLKASTYVLWFGPFMLLAGGVVALYRSLKSRTGRIEDRPLSAAERKRVRKLLYGDGLAQPNLDVYREQLAELELDRGNGVITEEQFQMDREELERRLILDIPVETS
jgi:cytochrome c-type biogenesis protein CcmH